jgi:hypothetical protein
MIVKLTYTNSLAQPVTLRSNIASEQPLQAGQRLEVTFELQPGVDGVADLALVCEPAPEA